MLSSGLKIGVLVRKFFNFELGTVFIPRNSLAYIIPKYPPLSSTIGIWLMSFSCIMLNAFATVSSEFRLGTLSAITSETFIIILLSRVSGYIKNLPIAIDQ